MGSADWMYRNLHARVEAIVPIYDRDLKKRLWDLLAKMTDDHRQTWDMNANGEYHQRTGAGPGVQEELIGWHRDLAKQAFPEDLSSPAESTIHSYLYHDAFGPSEAPFEPQEHHSPAAEAPNSESPATLEVKNPGDAELDTGKSGDAK